MRITGKHISKTDKMFTSAETVAFIIIAAIVSVSGIIFNSFIGFVIFGEHKGFLRMSANNQIKFTICGTNVFMQCLMPFYIFVFSFTDSSVLPRLFVSVLGFSNIVTIGFSCWLTVWLCILYCVTVVNFKHKFFTHLKMRFPALVPKLLLVTALGSICLSAPSIWCLNIQQNMTGNLTLEQKINTQADYCKSVGYHIFFNTIGCMLPLTISVIALAVIVASLVGYVWRTKLKSSNLSDAQLQPHYKACKTIVLLIIIFTIVSAVQILPLSSSYDSSTWKSMLVDYLCLFYPTEMAVILILGSSELKQAFVRRVTCIKQ
ncbi:taste receptor type 2 member 41-like [Bombina bombina]|uniref:taste receptor type 2 member 41-like n=1 Tax=Bombina bombina TaxID=8345 RepID=UPI00235B2CC3|nr:taste receptor type 2 member 41-like [Bombina bombina]